MRLWISGKAAGLYRCSHCRQTNAATVYLDDNGDPHGVCGRCEKEVIRG